MDYSQQINAWFDDFDRTMTRVVPDIIAETAVEYYLENFQREAWNGHPWQPLSPKYAARKRYGRGRILTARANLQRSIRPGEVTPRQVRISAGNAKVPYARVHNEGFYGRVTVPAYVNPNFMGRGQSVPIKAHTRQMRIPQRQFIGITRPLNDRIRDRIIIGTKQRR